MHNAANDVSYRFLGRGLYSETLIISHTFLTLRHPIRASDLRTSQDFTLPELHTIFAYLEKKVVYINNLTRLLSHQETEINTARCLSHSELGLHLLVDVVVPGAYPLELAADEVKYYVEPVEHIVNRKFRRVHMGNGFGDDIDMISLPHSLGEFKLFNPLIPEDVRYPLAGLEEEQQLLVVAEILKAMKRRYCIEKLQHDNKRSKSRLNVARSHSIKSLWKVYRELFEVVVENDVIQYVEQRTEPLAESDEKAVGASKQDKEFFMIPKTGIGGAQIWHRADEDTSWLSDKRPRAASLEVNEDTSDHPVAPSAFKGQESPASSFPHLPSHPPSPALSTEPFPEYFDLFEVMSQDGLCETSEIESRIYGESALPLFQTFQQTAVA